MIDVKSEKLIPLGEVPDIAWLPRDEHGHSISVQAVYRWAKTGRRGFRLRTMEGPKGKCTSEGAVIEFFERLSMPRESAKAATPSQHRKAQARASAILAAAGI